MPQYYPLPNNWRNRGKITITYKPFWRRLPVIGRMFAYHVGERVAFHIHTEKQNPEISTTSYSGHSIHEVFRGKTRKSFSIDDADTEIVGSIIDAQGSIAYYLGVVESNDLILTAEVLNWDTIRYQVFWAFVWLVAGSIATLVTGTILGFIEIDKFWHIWQPDWFTNLFR